MKFFNKTVENLPVTGKRYEERDDEIKGFLVRVGINGNKVFYFMYRAGKGRGAPMRRIHLGRFPDIRADTARNSARKYAGIVAGGGDPIMELIESKTSPTVDKALAQFFEQHVNTKLKSTTIKQYNGLSRNRILPALGMLRVKDVGHHHIARLHHSMRDVPYLANRCATMLSKFFTWCEKLGYRTYGTNPVKGIEKHRERKRTAFMGRYELEALGNGIRTLEEHTRIEPYIAAAIKTLMFTGARCGEILTLKWEYIDKEHNLARLPDSKTGAKVLHLSPTVMNILTGLQRRNEYCFPGKHAKKHVVNIKETWRRVLEAGGISGWRIHDLRHAFASYAAANGKSLPIIGKLLGHSQPSTTARYAHLADNPVALAAMETAAEMERDFGGGL